MSEMDKTTARAAAAVSQLEPCGAAGFFFVGPNYSGQRIILHYPTPREINSPCAFRCRAGQQFTDDQDMYVTAAHQPWLSMDWADLETPIEREANHIWEQYIGQPMAQDVRDTCALIACIKCVEAVHRLQHEKLHRLGTPFPYNAAAPSDLLDKCRTDGIWKPGVGAYVRDVLSKIQEMGGVQATKTTDAPTPGPCVLLPLRSWEEHTWWNDDSAGGLSPERVAGLLSNDGPCIGVLWVSPWYHLYHGDGDNALVYTSGCGRSDDDARRKIAALHRGETAWHAVVCFGYRFRGKEMHVLVLDNHTATGPRRWIHVDEFHALYTLSV